MLVVDRHQVLAHRIAMQGLLRDRPLERLRRLGIQETGPSAAIALAARGAQDDAPHVTAWTHRGAPHRHRPGDLPGWAVASRPLDDPDAAARVGWSGPAAAALGMGAREAIERTADALAAVVTEPTTKGAASAAVTRMLPDALLRDCGPCGAVHVHEQLMRRAALPAAVALDTSGPTLLLVPGGWERPGAADPRRSADLVRAYLAVLGPATPGQVAGFAGTTPTAFAPAFAAARDGSDGSDGLVEVEVTGHGRAWLPAADADALAGPPEPAAVRLLPPMDPLLQARDRELLVPDAGARKDLYRVLGNPGAVLAGGELVGTWRPKASGRRLTLLVRAFAPLPADVRSRIDEEAQRVAAARGLTLAGVTVTLGA